MHTNFKDYFRILGLDIHAEDEVIKAVYRTLIRKYHPDSSYYDEQYIQDLNEAYSILKDQTMKEQYLNRYRAYFHDKNLKAIQWLKELKEKEDFLIQKEHILNQTSKNFVQDKELHQSLSLDKIENKIQTFFLTNNVKTFLIKEINFSSDEKREFTLKLIEYKLTLSQWNELLSWSFSQPWFKETPIPLVIKKSFLFSHLYFEGIRYTVLYQIEQYYEDILIIIEKNVILGKLLNFNQAYDLLLLMIEFYTNILKIDQIQSNLKLFWKKKLIPFYKKEYLNLYFALKEKIKVINKKL